MNLMCNIVWVNGFDMGNGKGDFVILNYRLPEVSVEIVSIIRPSKYILILGEITDFVFI